MGDDYHPALRIERCEFPLIRAVHFVVYDFLGSGVSSTSSVDALGKVCIDVQAELHLLDSLLTRKSGLRRVHQST